MRLVIQRVKSASCMIDDADTAQDISYAVRKIVSLRIFSDADNKMNLSVKAISDGSILSISQFTLFAATQKGNRPSFTKAGNPIHAKTLYDQFNQALAAEIKTVTGVFGADMQIALQNDGPVTLIIDTSEVRQSDSDK